MGLKFNEEIKMNANRRNSTPYRETPSRLGRQWSSGSEFVTGNRTLLKAVRIPEDFTPSEEIPPHIASRVLFDLPDKQVELVEVKDKPSSESLNAEHRQNLVTEDDPVNRGIIQKRLEKSGHEVHHTVNREDCASAYGEMPAFFDIVLMDMQVSERYIAIQC